MSIFDVNRQIRKTVVLAILMSPAGCCPFSVTAVSEAEVCNGKLRSRPEGIPYYLPKPLLVISKNFTYIEEAHIGLTEPPPIPNAFDKQESYATLNATASISTSGPAGTTPPPAKPQGAFAADEPPAPPKPDSCCSVQVLHSDKIPMAPDCEKSVSTTPFFTYQILFIPDLTQKHYLRIKGGPGEVRASLNLVNGWMYTGLGPFYLKDSSTAQNILAAGVFADFAGAGAADVINSAANLGKAFQQGPSPNKAAEMFNALARLAKSQTMIKENQMIQADIHVFEPFVTPDGGTEWREINLGATHFEGLTLSASNAGQEQAKAAIQGFANTPDQVQKLVNSAIELDKAEALAEINSRARFQEMSLAAVAAPPDPSTDKAVAVQALTPPVVQKKGLFDWLHCKRSTISNQTASGPTALTLP